MCDFKEAKRLQEKWVMLTAYDKVSAKIFDKAKIPLLLVGDSGGQMLLGHKSTITVTLEEMIIMSKAVMSSCERCFVVADLPFGTYEESPEVALRSSLRLMKEAAVHGVKLEGGKKYAKHVKLLTDSGIPVVGHIGFTPQSEHILSGFRVQGRGDEGVGQLIEDAIALQEAGAFACVLELVPTMAAKLVTDRLQIPTIGVGGGMHCDAHGMVWNDMAGFTLPDASSGGYLTDVVEEREKAKLKLQRAPKFVKRYANLSDMLYNAARELADDVTAGRYPLQEHSYQ